MLKYFIPKIAMQYASERILIAGRVRREQNVCILWDIHTAYRDVDSELESEESEEAKAAQLAHRQLLTLTMVVVLCLNPG